jgi:hypothetical protein
VQTQTAVVIPNFEVPPKDPSHFREVSFILAEQLNYLLNKLEPSD